MALRKSQPRSSKADTHRTLSRSLILGGVLALWMIGLVGRLYHLEILQYVELLGRAQRQQQRTVEVAPQRGTIFDRQMQPLAMSLPVESIYAVPAEIPNREMVSSLLAPVLHADGVDLLRRLKTSRTFCWVKRKVSSAEAQCVRDFNLKEFTFRGR